MRLSEKKRSAVYDAIHEEIMRLRVELARKGLPTSVDFSIAQLVQKIYDAVVKELVGKEVVSCG